MLGAAAALLVGCGTASADVGTLEQEDDAVADTHTTYGATVTAADDEPTARTSNGIKTPPVAPPAPASPEVTAQALLAKLATCARKTSTAPFSTDVGAPANIDVCALEGAVFWKADMDIDCDGKPSAVCNKSTDAAYQDQTAATDSKGNPLDSATLPYVVVPGVSSRWSYKAAGVSMGSVAAVIYQGKIQFGIVGDIGPTSIIGEASYAMAKDLGINPDPSRGGVSSDVVYVVFTGSSGVVQKNEDHAEAVALAKARATQLLVEN